MARCVACVEDLPPLLPIFPLVGVLLLPRGRLPLNIFEPRYLAMFDDALGGDRMIGMIQPSDPAATGSSSCVFPTGCAGKITAFSETEDGRYLVTLAGMARFRIAEELPSCRGYRRIVPDWGPFAGDLKEQPCSIDRARLIALLQDYFRQQGLSANWESIEKTPDERLVTSLAMICPFSPCEKQALLEAGCLTERAQTIMTLLEIAVAGQGDAPCPKH